MDGASSSADDDYDMSYMNLDGMVRTVIFAGAIGCFAAFNWLVAENDSRDAAQENGPADDEDNSSLNVVLVLMLCVGFAHNYMRSRQNMPDGSDVDGSGGATADVPRLPRTLDLRISSRAIFDAADSGDDKRLHQLLETGANGIDWVNTVGRSALVQACAKRKPMVARWLIEAGADCALTDGQGRDALSWAQLWRRERGTCDDEHVAVVLRLLEARRKRAEALRRWRVSAQAVGWVSDLWTRTKETRYAPDGPGYEAARLDFERRASAHA